MCLEFVSHNQRSHLNEKPRSTTGEYPLLATARQSPHEATKTQGSPLAPTTYSSGQYSSVAQLCPTLCDPMNDSTPGFPLHHQLSESTQNHVCRVDGAIQPSHPLLSPCLPGFNLSQHQGLFQRVSSSYQVAKVLEFQLQHQSFH